MIQLTSPRPPGPQEAEGFEPEDSSVPSPINAETKRWPTPAPGVPRRLWPSPARAAAAARLVGLEGHEGASDSEPAGQSGPGPASPASPASPETAALPATLAVAWRPPDAPPAARPAEGGAPAAPPAPGATALTGAALIPKAAEIAEVIAPAALPAARSLPAGAAAATAATATAAAAPATPAVPGPAEEDRGRLRAVPPRTLTPAQRRRRARALLGSAAGLVVVVAFGLVYLHVVLAQRQFALDQLTQKVQTDRSTYERLRVQVAELGSPANIISRAEGQLGMRQPTAVTYLTPTSTIGGSAADKASASVGSGSGQAPAGDADWPQIKAQLAGSP